MNILHYIALGAAAVNVVKKVLGKRDLVQNMYSDHRISVDSVKLYRKYGIEIKRMYLVLQDSNEPRWLYSFCDIYVPQVQCGIGGFKYDYWIDLAECAEKNILGLCNKNYHQRINVFLADDLPDYIMEKARRRGCVRIKPKYSVFKLSGRVGGLAPLKGLLNDIIRYMYHKCIIDGVIPRDCVSGL